MCQRREVLGSGASAPFGTSEQQGGAVESTSESRMNSPGNDSRVKLKVAIQPSGKVDTSNDACYQNAASQGNHEEAERLYRRALAIDEKVYGRDHPEVATVLHNIAVLLDTQVRFKRSFLELS